MTQETRNFQIPENHEIIGFMRGHKFIGLLENVVSTDEPVFVRSDRVIPPLAEERMEQLLRDSAKWLREAAGKMHPLSRVHYLNMASEIDAYFRKTG